jgi:protein-disulfide isomerase
MTGKDSRSRKQKGARELTAPVNIGSDHIRGSINNAPITLVEYGDYECPYTGMAYPVVKEIMKKFGDDKICFVFRNFPLIDIHPHAQPAAEAAEAAAAQDKCLCSIDRRFFLFKHYIFLPFGFTSISPFVSSTFTI